MFITDAYAQTAQAAGGGGQSPMLTFIMIGVMFLVMYFFMIRPQVKRQKEHRKMVDALAKGDEVIAAGGIYGRVTQLAENTVNLEIADGVEIQIQRGAVGQVLPKGTIK